ncbi:MAG: hypothetical protein [Olavius algarvensis Gamma 1 endosymbiont]|nr:MAG: hypothetical protein [Olavius algarvensis Gamma 1 endosymbiont]
MYRIGRPDDLPSNQPQLKQRKILSILKILFILYHWKKARTTRNCSTLTTNGAGMALHPNLLATLIELSFAARQGSAKREAGSPR